MRLAILTLLFSVAQILSPSSALTPEMTYEKRLLVTTDKRERVKLTLLQVTTDMKEVQCALKIAYKESRYNVDSHNKSSGARGVWQLLWGQPQWSLLKQTEEAHKYVLHRYETWCDAFRFHQERNWY
jgi:hypothetical protein